jgi:ectoine hydroxylase-related dioxygenase (phytanoyl-CoA dioxygenase family)
MELRMGNRVLTMGSEAMTELRSSNELLHDMSALRGRLQEDGYLLLRGLHDRDQVLRARMDLLQELDSRGKIDRSFPLEDGVIAPDARGVFMGGAMRDQPKMQALYELVSNEKLLDFFSDLLGGAAMTYDYKWPRAVGAEENTGAHYDIVYMGRGTKQLYTMWTPLGDLPYDLGTLAMCLGSQHFDQVKQTYGQVDIDRDQVSHGNFSDDPLELVEQFGGQWATTEFKAGDVIIFGMFMMHASTNNQTNRYRLSCDTRYQLCTEPIDERWMGKKPKAHYGDKHKRVEDMRKEWGI